MEKLIYLWMFLLLGVLVSSCTPKVQQAVSDNPPVTIIDAEEPTEPTTTWHPPKAPKLPDNFFYTTLENGMEVLVIEDNTVPLATLELVVRNGAYTESDEYDGLSHLYEHMFFKANKDIPSQEDFMARVRELGISFNGTTSTDRVNYFITLSNQKTQEGLEFLNSAIRYPLFLEEEMKKENPVVDGEFQRAESSPTFFLLEDMRRALWGKEASRKSAIGDHDIILTATPEKMRIIQKKYYYPNNTLLAIAGDVDHKEMFKKAEAIYGDWEPSDFDPFEKYPIPEFDKLKGVTHFITENENARTPIILMSWHGPDTRNDVPGTYAADVFSTILSQSSSKFKTELMDAGLAVAVQEGYQTHKYVGPIQMFIVPTPGKEKEAVAKVYELIEQFDADDFFTDEQLETAKTLLAINDAYGKEKTSQFVHTVTYWWATASIDYYTNYVENLSKVTRQDIKDYIGKYYKGKPHVVGMLVSPEMKEQMKLEDLKTYLEQ